MVNVQKPLHSSVVAYTEQEKLARTPAKTIVQIFLLLSFQNWCPFQHPCNSLFFGICSVFFRVFSCPAPFPAQERDVCTACCQKQTKNTCSSLLGTIAGRLVGVPKMDGNTHRNHTFCYRTDTIACRRSEPVPT